MLNNLTEQGVRANQLNADERQAQVAAMLKAGATYRQIAKQVGCSVATVARDYQDILADWRAEHASTINEAVVKHVARLDALLMAVWARATQGNLQAIDRALKILDQIADVYGMKKYSLMVEGASEPSPMIVAEQPVMDLAALTTEELETHLRLLEKMRRPVVVIEQE